MARPRITMTVQEKFDLLSSWSIKLRRRDDQRGDWRLRLDGEDEDAEFVCEYPTVEECLDAAIKYVGKHYPDSIK